MILAANNPMRPVFLTLLISEVVIFGLAIPVMIFVSGVAPGLAAGVGGAAALLALVGSGLMRKPAGYLVGWFTQLVGIGLGVLTPAMYAVGGLFAVLWVVTFILGRRLEANRGTAGA